MIKASLQLGLNQSLKLTPQLTQAIRLLTLSSLELEQEIGSLLESNPVLEDERDRAEDDDLSAALGPEDVRADSPEGETPEDRLDLEAWDESGDWQEPAIGASGSGNGEDDFREQGRAEAPDLQSELAWQMALVPLTPRDRQIAAALIDGIDADGLLRTSLDDIVAALPASWRVEFAEIEAVLRLLQQCDPPGVAARDLRECLLLQLRHHAHPQTNLARQILRDYLDVLPKLDLAALARKLGASRSDVEAAMALIRTLNPRPGERPISSDDEALVPDLVARKIQGRWRVSLNPGSMPSVAINRQYEQMAAQTRGETQSYLRGCLQEAKWLMKSLAQRGETLLKVGNCILREQGAFLDYGPEALRPLTLRTVAEEVGLHESTVSRATTRKYMATPRGVFELKRFFSSGVSTSEGGEASATAIQSMIRKLIDAETKSHPLSDQSLTDALKREGIQVARRTVAKYREAMNIPSSSDRMRKA